MLWERSNHRVHQIHGQRHSHPHSHPRTVIYIQELLFTAYIYRRRGRRRAQPLLSGSPAPQVSALMSAGQMRSTSGERTRLRITPSKGDGDRRRFREERLGAASTEVKGEAIIPGCADLWCRRSSFQHRSCKP